MISSLDMTLHEESSFVIGEYDETVKGRILNDILTTMKQGEKSEILFENGEASGTGDAPVPKILLTLVSFTPQPESWQMEPKRKLEIAKNHKTKGTELFKSGDVRGAFSRFSRSAKYLICMQTIQTDLVEEWKLLFTQIYLNIAMCHLKQRSYQMVIDACDKALDISPHNVKGLYRRACALMENSEIDSAICDLKLAAELEPQNTAVLKELQRAKDMKKLKDQNITQAMSKMFK